MSSIRENIAEAKKRHYLFWGIALFVSALLGSAAGFRLSQGPCAITAETVTVRGGSLEPKIENDDKITLLYGYYRCHTPRRNDIVAYRYAPSKDPLLKIVRGIPGDTLAIVEAERKLSNITINGIILETSEGKPYLLTPNQKDLLSLYIKDHDGIIPQDSYLLLSNLAEGGIDSRTFGLAGLSDMLAKAK
ncbi:MAG: signal peptidase I [Patescibacteria group bacterium]